jgi:hypothetical protein
MSVIFQQPDFFAGSAGTVAVFTCIGAGSHNPITYQWYYNGVLISGATGTQYTTGTLTSSNNGDRISCIISDGTDFVQSQVAPIFIVGITTCDGLYGNGKYAVAGYKVCGASGAPGISYGLHYSALVKLFPVQGFQDVV